MGKRVLNMYYDLIVKQVESTEFVKKYTDLVVFDIKSVTGENSEIEICVEQEAERKNLISVSIVLDAFGEQFITQKKGQKLYPTLNKAKRAILKSYLRTQKQNKNFEKNRIRQFNQWGIA